MSLEKILKQRIKENGPISVAEFMSLALGHSEHGYYMKKDPFGRGGDFTTAPEISQMFGEMLGVWAIDAWDKMGAPERFVLLECGPGRGTLMADMLRVALSVDGFHDAVDVVLMEMSPVLRGKQAEALADYDVRWIAGLDELEGDCPVIVVGNEFLDALPIHQYEMTGNGWVERCVGLGEGNLFYITQSLLEEEAGDSSFEIGSVQQSLVREVAKAAKVGDVFEISPAQQGFMRALSEVLQVCGGAALFVDYGHVRSAVGDTLQAVYKHEYCGVLEHIGDADLTAHVDFEALQGAAGGLHCHGVVEQGIFLQTLGISTRAKALLQKADESQAGDIVSALQRLTADDQMGKLFKVIGFSSDAALNLAGF